MAQLTVARACGIQLAHRGCITVGEFEIAENFIMGPAVDAVAESERLAEGPFVWFLEDAVACWKEAARIHERHGKEVESLVTRLTINYKVPLKGGKVIETMVINPLANPGELDEKTLAWQGASLLRSFAASTPEVDLKRGNAEEFLRECLRHSR